MSSGEVKKVSCEDIQRVQNLIEQCLQLYMSRKQVVDTLLKQENIEPTYTELVWKKLVEENGEFFKAYNVRLMIMDQVRHFNQLLDQHTQLMNQVYPAEMVSIPTINGSHCVPANVFPPQVHLNSACYAHDQKGPASEADNIHQSLNSFLPNKYTDGIDMSTHAQTIHILAQNSNLGMPQIMNEVMTKSGSTYSNTYEFGHDENAIGFNSYPLNDDVGVLGQIPCNFSLSDLPTDYTDFSDFDRLY